MSIRQNEPSFFYSLNKSRLCKKILFFFSRFRYCLFLLSFVFLVTSCSKEETFKIASSEFNFDQNCPQQTNMFITLAASPIQGFYYVVEGKVGFPINPTTGQMEQRIWCPGVENTLSGNLEILGYKFESDSQSPLIFKVIMGEGYVYRKGKGVVTTPDGKKIYLGGQSSNNSVQSNKNHIDTSYNKIIVVGPSLNNSARSNRHVFNEPSRLPPTGKLKENRIAVMGYAAPLTILTRANEYHYFVKLVDWTEGTTEMTYFIRSGETLKVGIPLGSYKIKYAAGQQWYGESLLFGPETIYSEADNKFDFALHDNNLSGYTVELILQPNGNLRTKRISPAEF